MTDWLRLLLMMFYAPSRAMREVRDRAPLGQAALIAWLVVTLFTLYALWPSYAAGRAAPGALTIFAVTWRAAQTLLFTAIAFVPVLIFVANLFERRGSFGVAVRQEYAAAAAAVLYARAASDLAALPLLMLARVSGFERFQLEQSERSVETVARALGIPVEELAAQLTPQDLLQSFATMVALPLFVFWLSVAVREVFRLSWLQSAGVILVSGLIMLPVTAVLGNLFGFVFASPFLLLLLFFLARGYIGEVMSGQRARTSFKQNLEAATLNPADASAHYNLGLIHLQRKELDEARPRFERAVEIDANEVDAHYQLGRVARMQKRLPDAVKHFEQVVARDPAHAQHEIWREIGATYLAAGQFADAYDALERFLEHRTADPEGFYLAGRSLAGMGRRREAAQAMQSCIEAVKTAPAYKYRTEKRWLNEAQQFLRSQA
ncbi:MAG TPA: tetratricopeptide repeat protein [Pyrinomonadaceae bacterium]|nr:tetratricopeptide repeat protein [Pyrinomonadaceae bacterium]